MKYQLEELLNELSIVYEMSDNKNNTFCAKNGRKWGYELVQSALIERQPMIIGFNWGVHNSWEEYINGNQYKHQTSVEKRNFVDIYMASLTRSMNLCMKEFPDIDFSNGSHSNFCFFRSEKENQITEKDIKLCIPIFRKLIEILNPSIIFCFSSRARDYMINNGLFIKKKEYVISLETNGRKKNTFRTAVGLLCNDTIVCCLPHPNSKIRKEVRQKAWKFCKEYRNNIF
jgi:uracil-DNA glycosylase